MLLKIMGLEDADDSDSRRTFHIMSGIVSVDFERREDGSATAYVVFEEGDAEKYDVDGNAYVMNDNGKTVASFGSSPIPEGARNV